MPQRGPYSKTAQKREQILDAALEILSAHGYTGATLQQIADAVGMSKPGVLHHFGSRDELVTAVLAKRDQINASEFDTDDMVIALISTVRQNPTVPGLVALYAAFTGVATTDPEAVVSREFLSRRYPWIVAAVSDTIRARQDRGEVPSHLDPDTLARLMVAASDGLQTQWLIDPSVDMAGDLESLWARLSA